MEAEAPLDPTLCPLCGAANSCAIAAGSQAPCWCASVEISGEALARLPDSIRDKACLCPRCAARLNES